MVDIIADATIRATAAAWLWRERTRQRLTGDTGELSTQQVIWIATLTTIAVTVGGIIASKVTSAANSINLGGAG